MSDFKNVITKSRKEQDLNQQEFADKLGVSKARFLCGKWENVLHQKNFTNR